MTAIIKISNPNTMENFVVQYALIGSAMMTLAVQFLKNKWFKNADPRIIAGFVSGAIGLLYAAVQQYAPQEFILQAGAVATAAFGAGTALYKLQK